VTSVLTGPRTAAELLENVDAFNVQLPADIWAELEEANLIERIPA
jgi:aryl-alcohol dehydrogenase-like predicted oxidoreductase